jgi:hypothetical protein
VKLSNVRLTALVFSTAGVPVLLPVARVFVLVCLLKHAHHSLVVMHVSKRHYKKRVTIKNVRLIVKVTFRRTLRALYLAVMVWHRVRSQRLRQHQTVADRV